jgi:hypothetical protein
MPTVTKTPCVGTDLASKVRSVFIVYYHAEGLDTPVPVYVIYAPLNRKGYPLQVNMTHSSG